VALLGVEVGDTGWRIVGTAFSITGAALVSLPSVAAWERKKLAWLPIVGVAAAVMGFALVIGGIWIEPDSEVLWKIPTTLIITAVAISGASLLEFARLDPRHHWVLSATRLMLGTVAVMLSVAVWGEIDTSGYWRGFGVVSVLLAAFLASVPVLHRSSRGAEKSEFCPMCGAHSMAAIGEPAVCPTCDRRYRVAV
jgi:peptidoglycan/LPS O-acetylase OafA/YrhL